VPGNPGPEVECGRGVARSPRYRLRMKRIDWNPKKALRTINIGATVVAVSFLAPLTALPRLNAEWLARPAAGRAFDPGRGTHGDSARDVVFRVRLTWDVGQRGPGRPLDERPDFSDVEAWLGWWSAADASLDVAGGAR
jgi:hypothetical protein